MSKYYQVEKILDKQVKEGNVKYLIKWIGFSKEDSTWEPLENLSNILHMVSEYENKIVGHENGGSKSPSQETEPNKQERKKY
jgi:hypothetical protein